jgi:hypothetical protein
MKENIFKCTFNGVFLWKKMSPLIRVGSDLVAPFIRVFTVLVPFFLDIFELKFLPREAFRLIFIHSGEILSYL